MNDLLMELADLLDFATDRDPVHARQLAEAALAAGHDDNAEAVWTIDLPIDWDGEVQHQRLGLYLGEEAPGDDHPDDEGVFFWLHARDVPALIAGKDISGDGWTLAKPDATDGPAPRTASLLVTVPRTVVVHGTVTYRCTMLTHETDEQIRQRFAADPAAAFQWARSADEVEIEAEHDHASETVECREAEAEVEID